MRALSIRQPWVWAILEGRKRVENRTWGTRHRGPLLLHVSSSRADLMEKLPDGTRCPDADGLAFGAFVGVVDVVDCVRLEELEAGHGPMAVGPWCWLLEGVGAFEKPVPAKGQTGLFRCEDPAVLSAVAGICTNGSRRG